MMLFSRVLKIVLAMAVTASIGGIAMAAKKREVASIPVPKNIIYAGQRIEDHLLKQRRVPAKYLLRVSVITHANDVAGMIARTTLMPNRPIPTNYVVAANAIEVGKPTIMTFTTGMLSITGEVVPMNSAKAGGHVRARNLSTGVIISGIAQADGTIAALNR